MTEEEFNEELQTHIQWEIQFEERLKETMGETPDENCQAFLLSQIEMYWERKGETWEAFFEKYGGMENFRSLEDGGPSFEVLGPEGAAEYFAMTREGQEWGDYVLKKVEDEGCG